MTLAPISIPPCSHFPVWVRVGPGSKWTGLQLPTLPESVDAWVTSWRLVACNGITDVASAFSSAIEHARAFTWLHWHGIDFNHNDYPFEKHGLDGFPPAYREFSNIDEMARSGGLGLIRLAEWQMEPDGESPLKLSIGKQMSVEVIREPGASDNLLLELIVEIEARRP